VDAVDELSTVGRGDILVFLADFCQMPPDLLKGVALFIVRGGQHSVFRQLHALFHLLVHLAG